MSTEIKNQTHPLKKFKPGNSVKVEMVNGSVIKGIYLGEEYANQAGLYVVVYEYGQNIKVVNLLRYFTNNNGPHRIRKAAATRLTGGESATLRMFYKEYERDQGISNRAVLNTPQIRHLVINNPYKLNISQFVKGVTFNLYEIFEDVDTVEGVQLKEKRTVTDIENYLEPVYPKAKIENYYKLVDKYNHLLEFNNNPFRLEKEGHLDSYYIVCEIIFNFRGGGVNVTRTEVMEFMKDLAAFINHIFTKE